MDVLFMRGAQLNLKVAQLAALRLNAALSLPLSRRPSRRRAAASAHDSEGQTLTHSDEFIVV